MNKFFQSTIEPLNEALGASLGVKKIVVREVKKCMYCKRIMIASIRTYTCDECDQKEALEQDL